MSDDIWFGSCDTPLYAAARGAGHPVVLIHGGLADHRACLVFAEPLAERFRLITPDSRGAGRSVYAGPLSWDRLADDLAALLGHLQIERAVVGGISAGAATAVRFALRHPDLTCGLAVLTPAYGGADVGLAPEQTRAMAAMDAAARRALDEGIEALYPLFDPLPEPIRTRARAMVGSFDPPSVAATTGFLASGAQPFASAAELAAIAAPVLLVPGADPTHPAAISDVYARSIDGCLVRAAEPRDFAAVIGDFAGSLLFL